MVWKLVVFLDIEMKRELCDFLVNYSESIVFSSLLHVSIATRTKIFVASNSILLRNGFNVKGSPPICA